MGSWADAALLALAMAGWLGPGWAPAAGLAALGILAWRRRGRLRSWATLRLGGPVALLAGMGALGLVPSGDLAVSVARLLGLWLGVATFLGVCDLLTSEKRLWLVVSGLAVAGIGLAVVGLVGTDWPTEESLPGWLNGTYERLPHWITFLPRSDEGGLNGNKLAAALAMLLPLPAAVLLFTPGRLLRLIWGGGTALMLLVLLLTRSPSGLLAAGAAFVALACLRGWQLVGLTSAVAAGVGLAQLGQATLGLSLSSDQPPTLGTRLALWSAALDLIRGSPLLGIGIGTFPQVIEPYLPRLGLPAGTEVPHAHNLYLQFALDLGLPGLALFCIVIAGALRLTVRAVCWGPTARMRGLAAGAASGLVAYLVYGLTDTIGPGEKPGLLLWLLLGIISTSGVMAGRRARPAGDTRLAEPAAGEPIGSIIYLSSFEWTYHTARPQQLARALAAHVPVLYVETTGLRGAGLGDLTRLMRRLRRGLAGRYQPLPGVWVFSPLTLPFSGPRFIRDLNRLLLRDAVRGQARDLGLRRPALLTSLPTQASLDLIGGMGEVVSVYDCMDDLTAIPTVDASVGRTEAELAGRVDVMLAASTELKRLKRHLRQDIVVVEQGVDPTHFATSAECPPDLERLPRPRLTFVGGVDERLDFQLLEGIARLRPGWSIVLIGPELYVRVKQRVGAPNVYRLGYRAYECLPAYLQNTDVCLVPYADSAWARACNPVKVPEYLAAGRPVIATDLPALRAFAPYVRIVRGPEAFVAAAEALMATDDASARAARRARVREETWATRAAAVLAVGAAARQRTSTTSAFETVAVGER